MREVQLHPTLRLMISNLCSAVASTLLSAKDYGESGQQLVVQGIMYFLLRAMSDQQDRVDVLKEAIDAAWYQIQEEDRRARLERDDLPRA